jgi:hypothetical protein
VCNGIYDRKGLCVDAPDTGLSVPYLGSASGDALSMLEMVSCCISW